MSLKLNTIKMVKDSAKATCSYIQITYVLKTITALIILTTIRTPISCKIGVQSCWCPITAILLQLFVIYTS